MSPSETPLATRAVSIGHQAVRVPGEVLEER